MASKDVTRTSQGNAGDSNPQLEFIDIVFLREIPILIFDSH